MGVPSLFRWLSQRYKKLVSNVKEEFPVEVNGIEIPIDYTKPNPNGFEIDNLYLDMNGIIHPCCHPEDKPAPENEEEMMVDIFAYIDRIINMCRPRKLVYMAIDGVAPRAKMNQQRSRRFRAGQEARFKAQVDSESNETRFDTNCITPGTPFMDKLATCLKYYIAERLNSHPAWRNLNILLSDASVPGEGEHKIMDFIRKNRSMPGYDANTQHVIYGLDADLIMLSLATHEPHFKVLREDVSKKPLKCGICKGTGHSQQVCPQVTKVPVPKKSKSETNGSLKPFMFLNVDILREYLAVELAVPNLSFTYDFENAIDDWVFLIFFVGNDFLPHLPSLDIHEGAIIKLVNMWKSTLDLMGGFITSNGNVNLTRAQFILTQLAEKEDSIFTSRLSREKNRANQSRLNASNNITSLNPEKRLQNEIPQVNPVKAKRPIDEVENASEVRAVEPSVVDPVDDAEVINTTDDAKKDEKVTTKPTEVPTTDTNILETESIVFGEKGYKEHYYRVKFGSDDDEFRRQVATSYIEGLCWVLKYYYQGCCSWGWFYPYHYPPFASDFINVDQMDISFNLGSPLKPYEQLMGVLPVDSKKNLPEPFHKLMENEESPIIDFYPLDFKIDLNGKKHAWQGVVILPFIEEQRLLDTIAQVYPELTEEEHRLNSRGTEFLYAGHLNKLYFKAMELYKDSEDVEEKLVINKDCSNNIFGTISKDSACKPGRELKSPLEEVGLPDLSNNTSISVRYSLPFFPQNHVFKCRLLSGLNMPKKQLTAHDVDSLKHGGNSNFGRHDYQRHEYYKGRETYEKKTYQELVEGNYIDAGGAPTANAAYQGMPSLNTNTSYNQSYRPRSNYNQTYKNNQQQQHHQVYANNPYATSAPRGRQYNSGSGYNHQQHYQNQNQNQGYGRPNQNYRNQGHSNTNQGYNNSNQPYGGYNQGYGGQTHGSNAHQNQQQNFNQRPNQPYSFNNPSYQQNRPKKPRNNQNHQGF